MRMRIEKDILHEPLKQFVEERGLCVPIFFDDKGYLHIDVHSRNVADVTVLIEWLLRQ